jgi:hypothetical protein
VRTGDEPPKSLVERILTVSLIANNDPLVQESLRDPAWASALHIMTQSSLSLNGGVLEYVQFSSVGAEGRGIDFQKMSEGPLSSGEKLLVLAAWSLFNGGAEVNLQRLAAVLDQENFAIVIEAMRMRKR